MISTRIEGGNKLAEFRARRTADVQAIEEDTANLIAERQKELCPRSDINEAGHVHIADTIHVEKTEDGHRVVEGDEEHIYGPFLEDGTDKMAARPHQLPAMIEGRDYQRERYKELR